MISVTQSGNFSKTERFLGKINKLNLINILEEYGPKGVDALSKATPYDTGITSRSWEYEIVNRNGYVSLRWYNTHNDKEGHPIAIRLQYGHATRNGGYVQGRDYINPAIQPILDQIEERIWKEVTQNV